jgi:hypothetical protein
MTQWIARLEVEAELVLPDGAPPIEYSDPHGKYRIKLLNRAVRPLAETPLLEMQLEFEAPDLRTADEQVKPLARRFLHWLSFVTSSSFRVCRVERLIDWTPGLTQREQFVYHADRTDMPVPGLLPDLASTIATFNANEVPPEILQALRWYAKGVGSELIDELFHCFFFAIETIAEYRKRPDPVPDVCPRCRGPLFCATCNETPKHRPYARQAIRDLLAAVISEGADDAFVALNQARGRLMHGTHYDEIEGELPIPFEELVDRAGRIAWTCIMNCIPMTAGKHSLALLQPSTFVHRNLTVRVQANIGAKGGDPQLPRLEDQGDLTISAVHGLADRPGPTGPGRSGGIS